jgi:hypothetical protein
MTKKFLDIAAVGGFATMVKRNGEPKDFPNKKRGESPFFLLIRLVLTNPV